MRVAAVDLGAASARVAVVDLDADVAVVEVLHRMPHGPIADGDGTLRWDWAGLIDAVRTGLARAGAVGPLASIGVDAWGVDYGLLDAEHALVAPPVSYRDGRTAGWRAVVERIGEEQLYRVTGVQLMAINTIFQLAAHDRRELSRATTVLMLPELVVHALSGVVTGERTTAGTTALVDLATGTWSDMLLAAIGVDRSLLPPIEPPGSAVGLWQGVPVHLVGGHDTASAATAMAGRPAPGAAFASTGSWVIVGCELPKANVSDAARRANFSNEMGALGGVRLVKNVMGFWLLEQCRAAWGDPPVDVLLDAAAALPAGGPVMDATDPRFVAPGDMEAQIRDAARLSSTAGRDVVVRCILDSVAAATAGVLDELSTLRGTAVSELHLLGGGARPGMFSRLLEDACGVPVRLGSLEATALGNALVQGVALGRFADLDEARAWASPR